MTRVKRGYVAVKRRKRVLERAAGFRGAHSRLFRPTKQQVMKAMVASKRDRDKRKRDFRRLWINRINAADNIVTIEETESEDNNLEGQLINS